MKNGQHIIARATTFLALLLALFIGAVSQSYASLEYGNGRFELCGSVLISVIALACLGGIYQLVANDMVFTLEGNVSNHACSANNGLLFRRIRHFWKRLCICLLACLCLPAVVYCGGVVTTANEAALNAAMGGGGTVTFAVDGVITLTNTLAISNNMVLDGTGHSITISGSNSVPIFSVQTNASLMLTNLTLANGRNLATGNYYQVQGGFGGAICSTGIVLAVNCVFSNNAAIGLGGCLLSYMSSWSSPGSAGLGGAIYNLGTLIVSNCTVAGNYAMGGAGYTGDTGPPLHASQGGEGGGGAIYSVGNATIVNCIFSSNSASGGAGGGWRGVPYPGDVVAGAVGGGGNGGGICSRGVVSIVGSTFVENLAAGGSGGCGSGADGYFGGNPGGPGAQGVNGTGGGLCVEAGVLAIVDSTFSSNAAFGGAGGYGGDGQANWQPVPAGASGGAGGNGGNGVGGGIGVLEGAASLTNATLANNISPGGSAGAGGQGGVIMSGGQTNKGPNGASGMPGLSQGQTIAAAGGAITLLNSILDCSSGATNGSGAIVDAGHNLNSDANSYLTNSASLNNTNPELGLLGNYGGPTPTIPLLFGSPAIEAGDTRSFPATDQRGFPRPYGLGPDIGAFEFSIIGPLGQTVAAGASVQFNVAIAGSSSLSYQWQFDGINLVGQTNSTLVLSNVQGSQAGFYSVVARNSQGTNISPTARLAIPGANAYYYDHNDRLVGVEYGQGVSIGYIYDGNGNMVHQACLDRSYESNGLPVLWRFLNGLSPTNNSGSNAIYADADGDGWSNYAMWLLGLAPLNSNTMPTNLPNSNPVAVVLPGTNVLGSQATVSIVISNNLGNPSVPFLQFSNATTHGWSNATLMQVDGGSYSTNTRVAAWPSGSVHALVWNASCDLGPVHTGVWLRAQAKDVAFTGAWSDPVVYQVNTLPPPQFDSGAADLQVTPSGFHFLISNVDTTRPLVILASTNLSNWDAIFTISSPTNGTLQFLDTNAPYLTWRFYKATNQ